MIENDHQQVFQNLIRINKLLQIFEIAWNNILLILHIYTQTDNSSYNHTILLLLLIIFKISLKIMPYLYI